MAGPTKIELIDMLNVTERQLLKVTASNGRKRDRLESSEHTIDRLREDRNYYRSIARDLEGQQEVQDGVLRDVLVIVGTQALGINLP